MRLRFGLTWLAIVHVGLAIAAQAPSIASPKPAQIDAIFKEFDRPDSPGCAIAILHDGAICYSKGYGRANLEYSAPNSPDTVFHVASLSKPITAFAIQLLVQDGKLNLNDDIRRYVPEMHEFGKRITVADLLHHTSGLRDQWDLAALAGWRMEDVITEGDVLRLLFRQRALNFDPGSRYDYCNSGYTLLGLIVQRVSGMSLREFCRRRIFQQLGMTHTFFHDDYREIVANRAASYMPRAVGGFEKSVLTLSTVGPTGLMSTVGDYARWSWNLIQPTVGGAEVARRMFDTAPTADGRENQYASGLLLGSYRGLAVAEHVGADAGYRSDLLLFPECRLSLVCFANIGSADPPALMRKVADLFLAPEPHPAQAPTGTPALAPDAAEAGPYQFEPGLIGTFTVRGDKLLAQINASDAVMSEPLGDAGFRVPGVGRFVFKRGGRCTLYDVNLVDVGKPIEPARAGQDLRPFVGAYRSGELRSTFRVRVDGNALGIAFRKMRGTLTPIARDRFEFDGMIVRFVRGHRGRVLKALISSRRSFEIGFDRVR